MFTIVLLSVQDIDRGIIRFVVLARARVIQARTLTWCRDCLCFPRHIPTTRPLNWQQTVRSSFFLAIYPVAGLDNRLPLMDRVLDQVLSDTSELIVDSTVQCKCNRWWLGLALGKTGQVLPRPCVAAFGLDDFCTARHIAFQF